MNKATQLNVTDGTRIESSVTFIDNTDVGLGINTRGNIWKEDKHNHSDYYCKACQLTFLSRLELNCHTEKIHMTNIPRENDDKDSSATTVGKYSCKLCTGLTFRFGHELNKHISTCHATADGYHNCTICDKTFSELRYLRVHLKRHSGIRNHRCDICSWEFFEPNKLKLHMETHKTAENKNLPYKCQLCTHQFHNRAGLADHWNKHTGKRPYPCSKCPKTFTHRVGLHRHQAVHSNDLQYVCGVCDKGFKFKDNLQKHMVTHTNGGDLRCDTCNRAFGAISSLRRHVCNGACGKGRVNTVYVCGTCKFRFYSRAAVEVHKCHVRVADTDDIQMDNIIFMCSACGDIFKFMKDADSHMCVTDNGSSLLVDVCTSLSSDIETQNSPLPEANDPIPSVPGVNGNTTVETHDAHIVKSETATFYETQQNNSPLPEANDPIPSVPGVNGKTTVETHDAHIVKSETATFYETQQNHVYKVIKSTEIHPAATIFSRQYSETDGPVISDETPYVIQSANTCDIIYADITEVPVGALVLNNSTPEGDYISHVNTHESDFDTVEQLYTINTNLRGNGSETEQGKFDISSFNEGPSGMVSSFNEGPSGMVVVPHPGIQTTDKNVDLPHGIVFNFNEGDAITDEKQLAANTLADLSSTTC